MNDAAGVDKSGQRVREMFRQIAPRYDAMNHALSCHIDRYWRWRAVRALPWSNESLADRPMLDVCTGTGDLAIAMQRRDPKRKVIGTDFCEAMLAIARDKAASRSLDVPFLEADTQTLPYEDNAFAAVTVAFGLRNVADTDAGLREMTRVCAPSGMVLVLEFSKPEWFGIRHGYQFYFKHILPRIGQRLARNDKAAYEYLPQSVDEFPYGQALADRLTAAGLGDVRFRPLTFGVATLYTGVKPSGSA